MKIIITIIILSFAAMASFGLYLSNNYTPPDYISPPQATISPPPTNTKSVVLITPVITKHTPTPLKPKPTTTALASTPHISPAISLGPNPTPTHTITPIPTPPPAGGPTLTPTLIPTPTPPPSGCGSSGGCTSAEISMHNTRSNCWVYLRTINKVYNITDYVSNPDNHPGGDVIVPYCGMDIYDYFIGRAGGHRHSNSALYNTLQAYYLGPLI